MIKEYDGKRYSVFFDSIYNSINREQTPDDIKELEVCKLIREENKKYFEENAKEYSGVHGKAVEVTYFETMRVKKLFDKPNAKTYFSEHPTAVVLYYNDSFPGVIYDGYAIYDEGKIIFDLVTRIS